MNRTYNLYLNMRLQWFLKCLTVETLQNLCYIFVKCHKADIRETIFRFDGIMHTYAVVTS